MPSSLPNWLTLARIAAVPLLVLATMAGTALEAAALFCVAGLTDWLDGALARRYALVSPFGRMLDPIADKLLVTAVLLLLLRAGRMSVAGDLAAALIILRELTVSGLREYLADARLTALPVTRWAKGKTAVQMVALGLLLLAPDGAQFGVRPATLATSGEGLLWLAAALTVVTGWTYLGASLEAVALGRHEADTAPVGHARKSL